MAKKSADGGVDKGFIIKVESLNYFLKLKNDRCTAFLIKKRPMYRIMPKNDRCTASQLVNLGVLEIFRQKTIDVPHWPIYRIGRPTASAVHRSTRQVGRCGTSADAVHRLSPTTTTKTKQLNKFPSKVNNYVLETFLLILYILVKNDRSNLKCRAQA